MQEFKITNRLTVRVHGPWLEVELSTWNPDGETIAATMLDSAEADRLLQVLAGK